MRTRELERLLQAYRPIDALDERSHRAFEGLARSGGDPFSRARYTPGHVTASAFVLDPSGRLLGLIFHKKLARWLQPGGHVEERDPTLEAAARREAHEEIGLGRLARLGEGALDLDVHTIPARGDEPAHLHFDVRFAFVSSSAEAQAGEEVEGFRWVRLSEVAGGGAEASDESVARAARKLEEIAR